MTAASQTLRQRRRLLLGLSGLAASSLSTAQTTGKRIGSVLRFGADPSGRSDSSPAFQQAIAALDVVQVPAGEFLVGMVSLRGGVTLEGLGDQSMLRQAPGSRFLLTADSGSPDPSSNLREITLRRLQLRGGSDREAFSQFVHLACLSGVDDLLVEEVVFRGFRGDGLYLGSSAEAGVKRHNRRVVVRRCTFDGINRQNRNGISVIDCDGLLVQGCEFIRTTRSDMPGAIDIEPNGNPWHVVRNLRIEGNRFEDIGGIGAVCAYVPAIVTASLENLVIEGNTVVSAAGSAVSLRQARLPAEVQSIVIRGNTSDRLVTRPFSLWGVNGVDLLRNRHTESADAALIGWREAGSEVRNVLLRDNNFTGCGWRGGVAVSVFHAASLRFVGNEFRDCGNGGSASYVVDFNTGKSERVEFTGNHFVSERGYARYAIQREPSHHFTPEGNRFATDNELSPGLLNRFESTR